jgi:hypothetical protein
MSLSNASTNPAGVSSWQTFVAMYPTGSMPTAGMVGRPKRREITGWKESDYLDFADFENAIKANQEISYALCQWLMLQPHDNPGDPFTQREWRDWYEYALTHCPRFAKEQPRRR